MPGRAYSPDPCFPKQDWESQTSSPWKRDMLCGVPSRPTSSRSRKPHGENPARQSARHAANGLSVAVLRSEVSSSTTHGCGVGLSKPQPQGPEHRMVGCTPASPSCSPALEAAGRHYPLLSNRFLSTEIWACFWMPLSKVVSGQAPCVLAGRFAEGSSPHELGWTLGRSPATHPLPAAPESSGTAASEVAQAGLAGIYVSWSCFPRGGSWN